MMFQVGKKSFRQAIQALADAGKIDSPEHNPTRVSLCEAMMEVARETVRAVRQVKKDYGWKSKDRPPIYVDVDSCGDLWWLWYVDDFARIVEEASGVGEIILIDKTNDCLYSARPGVPLRPSKQEEYVCLLRQST